MSNLHTKFGWISSNGLGGDSVTAGPTDGQTDWRTDGGNCNIPTVFFKRGDNNNPILLSGLIDKLGIVHCTYLGV